MWKVKNTLKMANIEQILHVCRHFLDIITEIINRTNCFKRCPSHTEINKKDPRE